jgi:hypothetical protein
LFSFKLRSHLDSEKDEHNRFERRGESPKNNKKSETGADRASYLSGPLFINEGTGLSIKWIFLTFS